MSDMESTKPQKRKGKGSKILFWVLVAVLVGIIVYCLWQIGSKLITDAQDKSQYDTLEASKDAETTGNRPADFTYSTGASDSQDTTEPDGDTTVIVPDGIIKEYQLMYALNNDMIGWIEIPGTSIDLPVVQYKDQTNFYLRRNFYKEKATCGTIYAREKCDVWGPSDNVTLYGHNMRNGTMFADLHKYEKKEFWQENSLVYFDTLYDYHTYEIFAVFITSADGGFNYHLFDDADNAEEFDQFVGKCKELALYDTGITPQYGEKLLTLSTCDKSIEDGRLVVVARRIM